jgi:hypothetical protein
MLATLLGMFAELAGFVACFAEPDESAETALTRARPIFAVLLDGTMDAAQSDIFFAAAARQRVGVAIFGTPREAAAIPERARARGVPYFDAPTSVDEFIRIVESASASEWWRRAGERRQSVRDPFAEHGPDGGLVYVDRSGRRWQVFDRRGSDRRVTPPVKAHHASAAAEAALVRLFVGDGGETWSFPLNGDEAASPSAETLEWQFSRAKRLDEG